MKKLMKAIAFATVMCMLLSTAAFAANTAVVNEAKTGIDVTVEAEEGTQVALLILDEGVTDPANANSENILYIDQQPAAASGATFANVIIDADVAEVFVGYQGNTNPVYVGQVKFATVESVAISVVKKVAYTQADLETENQGGLGIIADLSLTLEEGNTASKMIWALEFDDDRWYSQPQDSIAGLSGNVRIAASFHNGNKTIGSKTADEITDVDVIVLTTKGGVGNELFSDDNDKEVTE